MTFATEKEEHSNETGKGGWETKDIISTKLINVPCFFYVNFIVHFVSSVELGNNFSLSKS